MSEFKTSRPDDEPMNPDVRFEQSDVNSRAALGFAVGLGIGLAVLMGAVWSLLEFLDAREVARKQSQYPVAEQIRREMAQEDRLPSQRPRIEGIPVESPEYTLGRFGPSTALQKRRADEAILNSYGWVNADKTIAHIPIEVAMQRWLQHVGPGQPRENRQ